MRVLNKNEPLENLQKIDEVYDNQAEMIEEIFFYNKLKNKKTNINNLNNNNISEIRENEITKKNFFNYENTDENEEDMNHLEYINNLKKIAF